MARGLKILIKEEDGHVLSYKTKEANPGLENYTHPLVFACTSGSWVRASENYNYFITETSPYKSDPRFPPNI